MVSQQAIGDEFRDRTAALLRTHYDSVQTEVQLTAKKADIRFELRIGTQRISVAAECKKWNRALSRDEARDIIADYTAAFNSKEIQQLWIICDRTPAAGARAYVESFNNCQLMTSLEAEQSLIDFTPLLRYLVSDFQNDPISKYFVRPSFDAADDTKIDLHTHITEWLVRSDTKPIAIWGGYGMGKTSYARFLAAQLAQQCLTDYASRIPILLSLGDFTTAPDLESLIFTQLANFYGIRNISSSAFRILNAEGRFLLILDGFDEMKFAMSPNEFNYISSEIRKIAAVNPKLLLLGRPGSIETDEEERRLTSSRLQLGNVTVRADDAPDFSSLRLSSLTKDQYLTLIRNFLSSTRVREAHPKSIDELLANVEALDLGDILSRPVQAKMLAEIIADPEADVSSLSRFTLYDMFIKRVLRREEEKAARRQLGATVRINFMRLLAWWLWTQKKTRTFAATEVPLDIVKRFEIPGVPLEGVRRELLVGSVLEERHIGLFLSEKTAGVFYFPHISFTEFLVADYIMSSDFLSIDVPKLPTALNGEVSTFLDEHPISDAIFAVFNRMKAAQIAMSTSCMTVLLRNFKTRMHVELVRPTGSVPWDICLHFFLQHAQDAAAKARQFALACLEVDDPLVELAGMFCLMYDNHLNTIRQGSSAARMILHVIRKIGIDFLISAAARGSAVSRSSKLNHLAEVVTKCIKISSRDSSVMFDFAEFTTVALDYFANSCAVSDVIEAMRKSYIIPGNDLLSVAIDTSERSRLSDLLRTGGELKIIPSL